MTQKIRKNENWFLLVVFLVNFLMGFLSIIGVIIKGDGMLTLTKDFNGQEIPFYIFCNNAIKSGDVYWNWAIDLGSDFITAFSFYTLGSPFFWISMLFPASMQIYVMGWLYMLKYAVAGLFSYMYIRRFTKNKYFALLGSFLYAFSGFQACNIVFYHFHDAVAFFPLLLIGVEKLMTEKKHGFLAIAAFINAFVNYFFFIGEVVFLVIYYVCRFIVPNAKEWAEAYKRENWKVNRHERLTLLQPIGLCMLEGIIGVMMAGALFIPSIVFILGGPKASDHIRGNSAFLFTQSDLLYLLKGMFFPADLMSASSSIMNENWMSVSAYLPMVGMFLVIAFLGKRKKDWRSVLLYVCLVFALVPFLNNIFVGMASEFYRRWFYMPVLIMAMVSAVVLENRGEYDFKRPFIITMSVMIGFIAFLILYPWNWTENLSSGIIRPGVFAVLMTMGISGVFVTYLIIKKVGKMYIPILLVTASLFGMGTTAYTFYLYKTTSGFKDSQTYYNEVINTSNTLDSDILPYRYYLFYHAINKELIGNLPSRNSFFTTLAPSIPEFYDAIGEPRMNNIGSDGPEGTNELLSVRYFVIEETPWENSKEIYRFYNGAKMIYVYEDDAALPIGFTYDSYMTRSFYEEYVDDELKAMAMLRTLVIDDEDEEEVSKVLKRYNPAKDGYYALEQKRAIMDEHRAESSVDFWKTNKSFGSTITASGDKYAFFSVPYTENWSATVNNQKVEILSVSGLMAVPVKSGINEIVFTYENKSIKLGVMASAAGVILLFVYIISAKRIKKWGDKESLDEIQIVC